jgi:hypothetical protein
MKTEEEYIDPYAANEGDFPEGGDIDEPGISAKLMDRMLMSAYKSLPPLR